MTKFNDNIGGITGVMAWEEATRMQAQHTQGGKLNGQRMDISM